MWTCRNSARTDSTASLLVGRLVFSGSYSLSNTDTVWETVSTFVLRFSQDGLLELLAFLIETKDTAIPQLPLLIIRMLNTSNYGQILFIFLLGMSAFIGKFILNIETGEVEKTWERVTHARSEPRTSQSHGMCLWTMKPPGCSILGKLQDKCWNYISMMSCEEEKIPTEILNVNVIHEIFLKY